MSKTETDEKIRVIVECDGKRFEEEGYTLIASLIALPIDAPMQGIMSLNYGRLSVGDYLSHVVSAIVSCRQVMKQKGIPDDIQQEMLAHATTQGMGGSYK